MFKAISDLFVSPQRSIKDAMEVLNRGGISIALIVNKSGKLLGTLTDGDIRRALLRNIRLEEPIEKVMNSHPVTAPVGMPRDDLLALMHMRRKRQIPLVAEDKVVDIVWQEKLMENDQTPKIDSLVVIMCGGLGTRLRPLTDEMPKPMLPVGEKPVLKILLDSLKKEGFRRVLISVHYKRKAIQEYLGDGSSLGLEIHYLVESSPLGTAGAIGLIPEDQKPNMPFLVVNGDVLTRLNFSAFLEFHVASGNAFTLCCRPYEVNIPFGYPVLEGNLVKDFKEKPTFNFLVNSGIYCLSPELLSEVPKNNRFDMTDLIDRLCQIGSRVGVFPLWEPFHEIGRVESYHKAESFFRDNFETEGRDPDE